PGSPASPLSEPAASDGNDAAASVPTIRRHVAQSATCASTSSMRGGASCRHTSSAIVFELGQSAVDATARGVTMPRMRDDELSAVADMWLADARAAWPDVALDEAAFVTRTAARLPAETAAEQALAVHAADLWLAAACAAGDAKALAHFDERYVAPPGHVPGATG